MGQRRSDQPAQPARDFKAYKRIDWRTLQTAARAWSGGWSSGDRGLRLFMAGAESSAVYTGDAPFPLHGPGEGHDPARRVPFVMVRRKGASTEYNAVLVPFRGASAVQTVEWPGPGLTRVELADGREYRVCLAGESARRAGVQLHDLQGRETRRQRRAERLRVRRELTACVPGGPRLSYYLKSVSRALPPKQPRNWTDIGGRSTR